MGLQSLGGPRGSESSGELRGRRPRRRDEDDDGPRGAPRGGPLFPPPRLTGRVSRMWRWWAAGGGGGPGTAGGPTGVRVTSGDRNAVAMGLRLTHRSRGMVVPPPPPLSRLEDGSPAAAPRWAGGAGE